MPRFVIDTGPFDIDGPSADALELDLHKVALSHLADLQIKEPMMLHHSPGWRGLYAHKDIKALFEAEGVLAKHLFDVAQDMAR